MVVNVLGENTLGSLAFTMSGNGRRSSALTGLLSLPPSPENKPDQPIA